MRKLSSSLIIFTGRLRGWAAKAALGFAGVVAVLGLTYLALSGFAVNSLATRRVVVEPEVLSEAVQFFPRSARLQGALADSELIGDDVDVAGAEEHALRAVALCPSRFQYRLTLAAAQESAGDRGGAESSLRSAVDLAPSNAEVRWQLANLLFRKKDLPGSFEQFAKACSDDESFTPTMLNLVWGSVSTNPEVLDGLVPQDESSQFLYARFLADHGRPVEAAKVFRRINPVSRRSSSETASVIDLLLTNGAPSLARSVWADLVTSDSGPVPIVWNGGFESRVGIKPFSRFDWLLKESKYAQIGIDDGDAHSGGRCLKVSFAGIDTTRLDGEISQSVVLKPATKYHLSFYVKTSGLVTPQGPRIVISAPGSEWEAATEPLPSGSSDWRLVSLDFTTPAEVGKASTNDAADNNAGSGGALDSVALSEREKSILAVLSVVRKPAFSYDDPTSGTVWFDDLAINEAGGQQ